MVLDITIQNTILYLLYDSTKIQFNSSHIIYSRTGSTDHIAVEYLHVAIYVDCLVLATAT